MSDSKPTAAEVNSGQPLSFPLQKTLTISLEVEIKDQPSYEYLLTPVGSEPQIGFTADLLDLFNFNTDLSVLKVNGLSSEDIRKRMGFV